MSALSPTRRAGVVYVLYFVVAAASGALAQWDVAAIMRGQAGAAATALWIASTAIYAILVVLLARLVWDVDPRIALAAVAFGLVGCAVQSATSLIDLGRSGPVAALFFFGLFMALYGWLIIRSTVIPVPFGIIFIVAGLGWCSLAIPAFSLGPVAQGIGALAEIALAVWLLARG